MYWYSQSATDTSLAFGATRSGWWMNGKAFTILDTKKKSVSLTDSEVQTFLEGKKSQYTKEKPKVTYSVALVLAFLSA